MEGTREPRIGGLARTEVPSCRLSDSVGEGQRRARDAGLDVCVVLNDERVVLGLLEPGARRSPPDLPAEEAMQPAPSTYRPDVSLAAAIGEMRRQHLRWILVTDSDGRLLGLLTAEDAKKALHERHSRAQPPGAKR